MSFTLPFLHHGNLNQPTHLTDWVSYLIGHSDAIVDIGKHNEQIALRTVKYSFHSLGAKRVAEAPPTDETRMTIVLQGGPMMQWMWLSDQSKRLFYLFEGDYLLWSPGYWHNWRVRSFTKMLTISFSVPESRFPNIAINN